MNERLRTYLARRVLTVAQARAGEAWYGDWLEAGSDLKHRRMDNSSTRSAGDVRNVMREAASARLRRVEATLGAPDQVTYRVAYGIVLQDRPATDVAQQLRIRRQSAIDILRLGLSALVTVYALDQAA